MKFRPRRRNSSPNPGWTFIILSLMLLAAAPAAMAQTVVVLLKNGDRLTGTLFSQDTNHLVLDTSIGRIAVPVEQIQSKEIKPPSPPPAEPPPAPQPAPSPAPTPPTPTAESVTQMLRSLTDQYEAGKITPAEYYHERAELLQGAATAGVAPSKIADSAPEKPAPAPGKAPAPASGGTGKTKSKHQWKGEARIGLDQGFGTKDRQLLTGSIKVTHAWQRLRNTADYKVAYGKTDGEVSANRMDGTAKTDWQINERYYLYNLGGAGYDEIRRIDLKYEEGPGVGVELSKLKNLGLSAEAGMNYYAEVRDELKTRENFYYRLAETLSWKLTSRLQFDEKFEWFPRVEDPRHYRIRFESNLQYLLGANLSFVLTFLDQYDTDPAPGVEQNDLQILSSLGVKF